MYTGAPSSPCMYVGICICSRQILPPSSSILNHPSHPSPPSSIILIILLPPSLSPPLPPHLSSLTASSTPNTIPPPSPYHTPPRLSPFSIPCYPCTPSASASRTCEIMS
ncbi:hypothetical protein FA13DRAFT_1405894 [Coprinellus micaceus]|uniref:Uncharacterized protein n=1 Tax=Coprinellus micaceus TaxID=71717 RepID=A0A4Y7SPA2_COPMI|nr:hypothetical protein FA13DRAFT_1405894 [Coprinellus micaceus]